MAFIKRLHCVQKSILILLCTLFAIPAFARDLADIQAEGVLRHIGVPYANFVTQYSEGNKVINSGLDIELMQNFARYIGVRYQFVPATWSTVFGKLTGRSALFENNQVVYGAAQPIEGDVMAHGVTVFDWRSQIVDFSDYYFPSAVWLIARAESPIKPINPSGSMLKDILEVKSLMRGLDVLAMSQSCLDPHLYNLYDTGANIILPTKQLQLNEMVPAILNNEAQTTLLDVADSLIALEKWSNEIKVIGPISEDQQMAVGFRKDSPHLRQAFNEYLIKIKQDGSFNQLVTKYYPSIFHYYQDYFTQPPMTH